MKDRIIDLSLERRRSTLLAMIGIVIFGIVARVSIPVESEPRIEIPFYVITVVHEGISPEDARRLLILPLEIELKAVEGVREITGTGAENMAMVGVEFTTGIDLDVALSDVREAVNRAKPEFPSTTEEPIVEETATTDYPVLQINLVGRNTPEETLYASARRLRDRIETVGQVQLAALQGHREEFMEILIRPEQLATYRMSVEELYGALTRNNRLIAAGAMDSAQGSVSVKVPSVIESTDDLLDIPVRIEGDTVVTLNDVASVRRTFKDRASYSHANGERSISVFVYRRSGANSIETATAVREVADGFRDRLPAGVNMFYSQDTSQFAAKQIVELQGNIVTALVLVMLVIFPAMGLRSSLLVAGAIPVSFLFALIFLWLFGHSFNFMVMFGMLLGLGMLIDGAIVVTEDAERRITEGETELEAYGAAAKRMFLPVLASTATTLAAFVPLMFWPGVAGAFMGYLPITLLWVLIGALLYALIFAPVLGTTFRRRSRVSAPAAADADGMWDLDWARLGRFARGYGRLLSLAVSRPLVTVAIVIALVLGIFTMHGSRDLGVLFFNENDPTYAQVFVRARGNLDVEEAYRLVAEVEAAVLEVPGIRNLNMFTTTGAGQAQGQRMQYQGGSSADRIGAMFIEMVESSQRDTTGMEVLEEVRRRTERFGGVIIEVRPFESQITAGKPIALQFSSNERERLVPVVERVREYIVNEVEGLRDIEDTLPVPGIEWQLEVDRALAGLYGADVSTVGLATQLVTNGAKLGEYRPDDADDALDIRIRYPTEDRGVNELDDLRIVTRNGPVPLSNFVTRRATPRLDTIQRADQEDIHMIRAGVAPGVLPDAKIREIQSWLDSQTFDSEVDIRFRGTTEEQEESIDFLSKAFSFALLLMFALLVTQFNNIYQSFLIMLAIVLSTAGVFLGLVITNQPFSAILSGVGVVSLAGIVVNNNIVLIDTYNVGRREFPGRDIAELIVLTGLQRLRPVLLTTVTTVIGLLPLASHQSVDFINRKWVSGGELSGYWVPLAQAVVSGLTFATILTLILTPALLVLPSRLKGSFPGVLTELRNRAPRPVRLRGGKSYANRSPGV
ncbi:MAG: efflux RND transporter permease subunit [Gammaproteobacteria bacterium]|nr:efflux RND transporter permease subunit [Gammaproteobacteria bacterium]